MHDDADDDTVPQAPRVDSSARPSSAVADDIAHGDTIIRSGDGAASRSPMLPPLPAALRPHHRIRVGGVEFTLDRPVQVGRNPRYARVPGRARPRLVTVESPESQISASHVELRQIGTVVVVTDLRTLNGSEVRVPGSPVVSLKRGESLVVAPGARIDVGEGVVVEVLDPTETGTETEMETRR